MGHVLRERLEAAADCLDLAVAVAVLARAVVQLQVVDNQHLEAFDGLRLRANIPIVSEEKARGMKPDYFLVLPYHFLPEMLEREKEFVACGGRFIVPVPTVQLIP